MRMGFLKCFAVLFLSSLAGIAQAEFKEADITAGVVGNYVGMQVGKTNLHAITQVLPNYSGMPVLTKPSTNGFGLRIYWGYQFTDYLGLETGYAYYSPAIYNIEGGNSPKYVFRRWILSVRAHFRFFLVLSYLLKAVRLLCCTRKPVYSPLILKAAKMA